MLTKSESEPAGWLLVTGDAVDKENVVSGASSRSGGGFILSLNDSAAAYHSDRKRGYEWSIKEWGEEVELSSLDAGVKRFQLLAEKDPPMSRQVRAGELLPSGKYLAKLAIYANENKVGDKDYLLTCYEMVFSLQNT